MLSIYLEEVGRAGPGRPEGRAAVLPGVGTRLQRAKAKRRALAVVAERHRHEVDEIMKNELELLVRVEEGVHNG